VGDPGAVIVADHLRAAEIRAAYKVFNRGRDGLLVLSGTRDAGAAASGQNRHKHAIALGQDRLVKALPGIARHWVFE
jgi:hypothetical protein